MTRAAVAVLAALAGTGCATITRGTIEALVIETSPTGATANLSSGSQCITPCAVLVKRRGKIIVTVEKSGYESARATVASSVKGAGTMGMAGNYLLGPVGIVGAVVDYRNGAAHSRQPNPLVIELQPLAQPACRIADTGGGATPEADAPGAKVGSQGDSAEPAAPLETERAMAKEDCA